MSENRNQSALNRDTDVADIAAGFMCYSAIKALNEGPVCQSCSHNRKCSAKQQSSANAHEKHPAE